MVFWGVFRCVFVERQFDDFCPSLCCPAPRGPECARTRNPFLPRVTEATSFRR